MAATSSRADQTPRPEDTDIFADSDNTSDVVANATAARPKVLRIVASCSSSSDASSEHNYSPTSTTTTTTSTSATANTFDCDGGGSGSGTTSPSCSFLPEMPQWKKDLIQRRKANVARTISASSVTSPTASNALDGLQSPTKDFPLKSTTVYQKQTSAVATKAKTTKEPNRSKPTNTTTTTSQETAAEVVGEKNAKLANLKKLPASNASAGAAGAAVAAEGAAEAARAGTAAADTEAREVTKKTECTLHSDNTVKSLKDANNVGSGGGHSTPTAREAVTDNVLLRQQQLEAALNNAMFTFATVAPIPKQRSLFLSTKSAAPPTTMRKKTSPTGLGPSSGGITSKSQHAKAEQETAGKIYSNVAASSTPSPVTSPSRNNSSSNQHQHQQQHQHQREHGNFALAQSGEKRSNNDNYESLETTTSLTTRLTSSTAASTYGEKAALESLSFKRSPLQARAVDVNVDVDVAVNEAKQMTSVNKSALMTEMQAAGGSSGATTTASGASSERKITKSGTKSGTYATTATTTSALSTIEGKPFAASPVHNQSSSKCESERTSSLYGRNTGNGGHNSNGNSNKNYNNHSSNSNTKHYSGTVVSTAVSVSNNASISLVSITNSPDSTVDNSSEKAVTKNSVNSCSGVSGVSGGGSKISTKLQNNQFIKNQQAVATLPAKYLKYKTHSVQETCGGQTVAASAAVSSPTKTTPAPASAAPTNTITATGTGTTTAFGVNNKKMVSVQEMKKTTQNVSHQHHHHSNHNHHQHQHPHQQQQQHQQHAQQHKQKAQTEELMTDFDAGEDLSYGPGIVSKLRCRYLTLALRETMKNQRNSIENLRRATSLNNLLDRDDHKHDDDNDDDDDEEDVEREDEGDGERVVLATTAATVSTYGAAEDEVELRTTTTKEGAKAAKNRAAVVIGGGIVKHGAAGTGRRSPLNGSNKKTAPVYQKYNDAATTIANGTRMTQSQQYTSDKQHTHTDSGTSTTRSRHFKRGNDSLKRARSVEALLCEKSPWSHNRSSFDSTRNSGGTSTCVTIEEKINNARERLLFGTDSMPPKRLSSIIDDTERPPPDLVKQTLKMFEATANRRGRGYNRGNSKGEVATKVANYKSIIKEQKPAIVFPKPPTSPTKKMGGGHASAAPVKPAAKPVVAGTDLLNSPVGRKSFAAAISTAQTEGQHYSSTPKHKSGGSDTGALEHATPLKSNTSSVSSAGSGLLSEHSPDIIPRQSGNKLLAEKSDSFVDSPVTALTRKLQKLRIESDKQQQQQQQQQQQKESDVTTKEFQTKQSASQSSNSKLSTGGAVTVAAAATSSEPYVSTHEVNKSDARDARDEREHNHDRHEGDTNKFIVGGDADRKNERDRAATVTATATVSAAGLCSVNASALRTEQRDTTQAGTVDSTISSDLSDDECGPTKRVTKKALDNIAKAGTTQQFKFATKSTTSSTATTTPALNSSNITATGNTSDIPTSVLQSTQGKQIGIIRPLPSTQTTQQQQQQQQQQASITPTSTTSFIHSTTLQQQHMETIKTHSTYSVTNSYSSSTSAIISGNCSSSSTATAYTSSSSSSAHSALTSREIEKNRINEMKKTALVDITSTSNNTTTSASSLTTGTSLDTVINTNASKASTIATSSPSISSSTSPSNSHSPANTSTSGFSELDAINATNSPLWALRKRRQAQATVTENTSMVFNFSNRKEVPDYIENDGVIFRRKRELPKPNESGFVLLGDLSLETSTDLDYDDFSMCPPSPCDVEFENANIVIDGKSSIRQKSKEATFHVQFNDTLTSTFEYPSEASLVIEDSFNDFINRDELVSAFENLLLDNTDSPIRQHHHVAVDEIIQLPTQPANTTNSTTANANATATPPQSNNSTPTKNILGNLPLDYPNLAKGTLSQEQQEALQKQQEQAKQKTIEDLLSRTTAIRKDSAPKVPKRPTNLPLPMPITATTTNTLDKSRAKHYANPGSASQNARSEASGAISKKMKSNEKRPAEKQSPPPHSSNEVSDMLESLLPSYKAPHVIDFKLASSELKSPASSASSYSTTASAFISSAACIKNTTTQKHDTSHQQTNTNTTTISETHRKPIIIEQHESTVTTVATTPTRRGARPPILSHAKYACFLQNDCKESKSRLILRTRSNEFSNNNNNDNDNRPLQQQQQQQQQYSHSYNSSWNSNIFLKPPTVPIKPQQQQQSPHTATALNKQAATATTMPQKRCASFTFGSAPLNFYTPVKAPLDQLFQLGVTRAPATGNGHAYKKNATSATTATTNGTTNGMKITNGTGEGVGNGCGSKKGVEESLNGDTDEPESLQYLKPANDDLTIAYSEGAQKTDLLY